MKSLNCFFDSKANPLGEIREAKSPFTKCRSMCSCSFNTSSWQIRHISSDIQAPLFRKYTHHILNQMAPTNAKIKIMVNILISPQAPYANCLAFATLHLQHSSVAAILAHINAHLEVGLIANRLFRAAVV
jgi:hypothetical protein